MTDRDQMTAAEAERRVNSVYFCGGTPEERRYALRRWKDAILRESKANRAAENRATAEAIR
jgi:hypothetical protein